MNQGQQAPPAQAPPAQAGAAAAPPQPPPPAGPPPPAPAFALGPGRSNAVLNFDDPNTGMTATKLYNKAIAPLDTKFDEKPTTWLFSLRVYATVLAVSIGNGSSPCQSTMDQQETSSLTTDKFPSTTRGHMKRPTSTLLPGIRKTTIVGTRPSARDWTVAWRVACDSTSQSDPRNKKVT